MVRTSKSGSHAHEGVPEEILSLEKTLREIQKSFRSPIPKERMAQYVTTVSSFVIESLVAAVRLAQILQEPLETTVAMVVSDKDKASGRAGTEQEMRKVLHRMTATPLGQEALLLVLHAVSRVVIDNPLLFGAAKPSLKEISSAASMFAAQPLFDALGQEKG